MDLHLEGTRLLPGRHVNDHQNRLYMKYRHTHTAPAAAAKAAFSRTTAYRFEDDPGLLHQKASKRERRRPDPLADIFEAEVVPLLVASPGLRAFGIFEEMRRRHPELAEGVRRTLERRVRMWRALHGAETRSSAAATPATTRASRPNARPFSRCRNAASVTMKKPSSISPPMAASA